MLLLETKDKLPSIANDQDRAYVKEDKSFYIYNNNEWKQIDLKSSLKTFGMSQYELNKIMVQQLKSQPLEEVKDILHKYTHTKYHGYFMLLCNDIHYYTVLDFDQESHDDGEFIEDLVISLLQEKGEIKLVDYTEDKSALECWIVTENKECLMFMLFDYDWGVIECQ